jgi:hypothetical protein
VPDIDQNGEKKVRDKLSALGFIACVLSVMFPVVSYAEQNFLLGNWTAKYGDCKSFVYEFKPDKLVMSFPKNIIFREEKTIRIHNYDVGYPILKYATVNYHVDFERQDKRGRVSGLRTTTVRFTSRDQFSETFQTSEKWDRSGKKIFEQRINRFEYETKTRQDDGSWKRTVTSYANPFKIMHRCP